MARLLDIVTAPWAITPDMLQEIGSIYTTHLRGEKLDLAQIEAALGRPLNNEHRRYEVIDGVAVLPIHGVIAKRMNLFSEISGGVSTELLARDLDQALADPDVNSIILDIDSPGGTVDGTSELGGRVLAAREQKQIIALANGTMASAAYWIGSAASRVFVAAETTVVGSIGVVATHMDQSERDKKLGITVSEISAGRYKRIASRHEPLSTEGRASIQGQVDYLYSLFVDAVAQQRGVDTETVLQNMADGRVFIGQQAIDAGLVDGISTLDALIAELAAGPAAPFQRARSAQITGVTTVEITLEMITNDYPQIAEALRDEGRATGLTEGHATGLAEGLEQGATAERERIQGIEAIALPGHEDLISTLKFDGKTQPGDAAQQIVAAESQRLANINTELHQTAPKPAPADPGAAADEEGLEVAVDPKKLAAKAQKLVTAEATAGNRISYAEAVRRIQAGDTNDE